MARSTPDYGCVCLRANYIRLQLDISWSVQNVIDVQSQSGSAQSVSYLPKRSCDPARHFRYVVAFDILSVMSHVLKPAIAMAHEHTQHSSAQQTCDCN